MKNIAEKIIYSLVNASEKINDATTNDFVAQLLKTYTIQLDNGYWKDLVKDQTVGQGMGLTFAYHIDVAPKDDDLTKNRGGKYLFDSLLFLLESLHLINAVSSERLVDYSLNNSLDARTYASVKMFQNILLRMIYYKDAFDISKYLKGSFERIGGITDEELLLKSVREESFLTSSLVGIRNIDDPLLIMTTAIYYLLTHKNVDEALNAMIENKDIHHYSILVCSVLGSLFYEDNYDFSNVKNIEATALVQRLNEVYPADFELPVFEEIWQKYTINEFNRMRYVTEGKDPSTYVDDPALNIYLEDEDQAHNEDYTDTIILNRVAFGLKNGYISEYGHILDPHKYNYDPDFIRHIEGCFGNPDYFLESFMIWKYREDYPVDEMIAYLDN